jgi:hypothetical protein
MSELVPNLTSRALSSRARRELGQAREEALIRSGKLALVAEIRLTEEHLSRRLGMLTMHNAGAEVEMAVRLAKQNPAAEPILSDLLAAMHEGRMERLTRGLREV